MVIALSIIGGAVVITLIGCGINSFIQKLHKNEVNNKQEENNGQH